MIENNVDFWDGKFFILYDFFDNFIIYIDNIVELKSYLFNYRERDIKRRFLKSKENYINVIVLNNLYKLYIYSDNELENIII